MKTIQQALSPAYPGRGIIMGKNEDSNIAVIAYFIMGRSANSRNRVFELWGKNNENLRTKAHDESKVTNPHLIIYNPVRVIGNKTIVTNGVQTDGIAMELMEREEITFQQAVQFIEFEPDAPIYTPRISSIMSVCPDGHGFHYTLSIVKTADGNPDSCRRFAYSYKTPIAGEGHFIHTYDDDDKNLPSFSGEPHTIKLSGGIDEFTNTIWESLNADNRVSLFTRYIDIKTGEFESRVVNKY